MTTPTNTAPTADDLAVALERAADDVARQAERLRGVAGRENIPALCKARALLTLSETASRIGLMADDLSAAGR